MFIPYNVDVPMERWPLANWALIGLTCILSVVFLADPEEHMDLLLRSGDDFAAMQLVTHVFLHAGPLHLIGNMMFLFVFGNAVNARLGHILFLVAYLACGVLSGLLWLATTDGGAMLGASGAIMGMVGAFLVYYPRNDVSVLFFIFLRGGVFQISAYWVILVYVAFDVWGFASHSDDGIAYAGHVGGAAAGFGIASLLLLTGLVKPGAGEQTVFEAFRSKGKKREEMRPRTPAPATPFRPPAGRPQGGAPAGRPRRESQAPPGPKPPPGGWR